jgi:hypothetical protein
MNARLARTAPLPLALALALALAVAPAALAADAWLHVRVEKGGDDPENVAINVPLEFAAKVLAAIDDEHLKGGKIVLDGDDHPDVDMAALWQAVKDAPDAEFVTVRSHDENVRVAKDKGYLLVLADEAKDEPGRSARVRIKVPLAVVDAMFGAAGTTGSMDLLGALRELQKGGHGELMTVEDGDETVRIWIDDRSESR